MELRAPIVMTCEGSNHPAHAKRMSMGICAMCGQQVTINNRGVAYEHERNDILAMLARGDFDDRR